MHLNSHSTGPSPMKNTEITRSFYLDRLEAGGKLTPIKPQLHGRRCVTFLTYRMSPSRPQLLL